MPARSRFGMLTLALAIVVLVLSCVAQDQTGTADRIDEPTTVTILHPGDERSFSPVYFMPVMQLVYLTLFENDENGERRGKLVRSWEHSDDLRTWTYRLRTDVRWHDGAPVTARDVEFTLAFLSHPDVPNQWWTPSAYDLTVIDDSTFTVVWHGERDPQDAYTVMFPAHLLADLEPAGFAEWDFWTNPVGNGPYRWVRYLPKTVVELEANPDYFRGRPAIDRVRVRFADGPTWMVELMAGNADAASFYAGMDPIQLFPLGLEGGLRPYYRYSTSARALFWNQRNPLFADARVRRALSLAIDRRELADQRGYGDDLSIFDVPVTGGQLVRGEYPEPRPYDPEEASHLLEAAGWADSDGDGVRDREGLEFAFEALPLRPDELVLVQEHLRRVGVHMEIVAIENNLIAGRVRDGDFDAVSFYLDRFFFGLNWAADTARTRWGYFNPRLAELIERQKHPLDEAVKDSLFREIATLFREDDPVAILIPTASVTVAHERIKGLEPPYRIDPATAMEYLWVEEE